MLKTILLWVLAVIITLGAAVYQRLTGPTYPLSLTTSISGKTIDYSLPRTHGGSTDLPVVISVPDTMVNGILVYKRFKTDDSLTYIPMTRIGDTLKAALPNQPPAGKLEYNVDLYTEDTHVNLPGEQSVVVRFKGAVPGAVILPHVVFIFLAMLWSTRTGLEAFRKNGKTGSLTLQTVLLLLVGGMIMGPIVQKFAFGEYWTGIPFGWDLTDNKTLVAFVGWLLALWRHRHSKFPRFWILAASLILIGIFTIPHSTMGSELNYDTGDIETG